MRIGTLGIDEVGQLGCVVQITPYREVDGEGLWLHVGTHQRTWVLDSPVGRTTLHVDTDDDIDPAAVGRWFHISERAIRFAEGHGGGIELSIVDGASVVTLEGRSAVIDLLGEVDGAPPPWQVRDIVTTTVARRDLAEVLHAAQAMPAGAVDVAPLPPMWMQLADGTLAFHVDWTDAVGGRATFRLAAELDGPSTTAAILHHIVGPFVSLVARWPDGDDHLEIGLCDVVTPSGTRRATLIRAGVVEMLVRVAEPLADLWADDVHVALIGTEVRHHDGVEWMVDHHGVGVRVVLHSGHPDVARVSCVVADHVDDHAALLAELNALNAATTGVRFWIEHGTVYAAADVLCPDLDLLPRVIPLVAAATTRYAPLLAALGAER